MALVDPMEQMKRTEQMANGADGANGVDGADGVDPLSYFFVYLLGTIDDNDLNLTYNSTDMLYNIWFVAATWHAASANRLLTTVPLGSLVDGFRSVPCLPVSRLFLAPRDIASGANIRWQRSPPTFSKGHGAMACWRYWGGGAIGSPVRGPKTWRLGRAI